MKTTLFVVLLSILLATPAVAGTPLEVKSTCADHLGERLVYAVKEEIGASSSLESMFDKDSTHFLLLITTMDYNPKDPDQITVYSYVLLVCSPDKPPLFADGGLGYCGSEELHDTANQIVTCVSELIDSTRSK